MTAAPVSQWQRFANIAVPVSAGLLSTMGVLEETSHDATEWSIAAAFGAGIAMAIALCWRRQRPLAVAAFVAVTANIFCALAPHSLIPYAGGFALYGAAARRSPAISLPMLAIVSASVIFSRHHYPATDLYFVIACLAAVWALGEASRNRHNAFEQQAKRMLVDEKARIARELHDVIAHSVSVIVVQAAAAVDIFDSNAGRARQALHDIETTGRQTLTELRSLLSTVGENTAPTMNSPQPRIADLSTLVNTLNTAGLRVDLRTSGEARSVPAGVELAVFRIVQEALTNTLRHSGSSRATVVVSYEPDAIRLEITDYGTFRPATTAGGGRGLVGMRERATMLGGTLDAGTHEGGGFQVVAVLPTKGTS
jgi:signal transduction histidine kinase